MWYGHDGPDGWGAVWMTVTMAVVLLPLIVLVGWSLRHSFALPRERGARTASPAHEPDARGRARRTYARGEIDRERYLEIIEDLDRTAG